MDVKPGAFGASKTSSLACSPAPLVSVIITNHNYARFLEVCLGSICGQTYPNIECIVVDDASTDNSHDVLDRIAAWPDFAATGRSLHLIKSAVNHGQTKSTIAGFAQSSGKYVICFDADDYMLPHCIEAHITAFFYSRYAVAISSVDMFYDADGEIISAGHGGLSHYITSGRGQRETFSRKIELPFAAARTGAPTALNLQPSELHHAPPHITGWVWGAMSALCFRREMLVPLFARPPKLTQALDHYLLFGIHPFTGSILVDRPLVVYRTHPSNSWVKFPRIEHLFNWDHKLHFGRDRRIAHEILTAFLASAGFYAQHLDDDELFLRAVENLFVPPWSSKIGDNEPFSMPDFLEANKVTLTAAFGEATYTQWRARYSWTRRVKTILQRLGWLGPIHKILQHTIGDAGIARLRGRLFR